MFQIPAQSKLGSGPTLYLIHEGDKTYIYIWLVESKASVAKEYKYLPIKNKICLHTFCPL